MSDSNAELLLRNGSSFGRYEIVRRIGRGGMGAVYEGLHRELRKRVAIKALLPPSSESDELRARFLREGQAAARIRHPHIVDIYDVGELDGVPFLVMEYLEGEDLGAMLSREGRLSVERAADILVPVLSAISAAHEEGVIHRDLKPANIFLARDRYGESAPKVLDFGISKVMSDRLSEGLTGTGAIFGTPFYMSPEQALGGKSVDVKSDQYSLGVIFYQALTGKRPFDADSMYSILHSIVEGTFLLPRMVVPELPERVEDIVLRAMAKHAKDRFGSVRELGGEVIAISSDRTRSRWSHAFPVSGTGAALGQTVTLAPAALAEPTAHEALEATVSPEPLRTIPTIDPQRGSRTGPLLVAALAGLLLSMIIGTVVWYATRPVEAIIVEAKPEPEKREPEKREPEKREEPKQAELVSPPIVTEVPAEPPIKETPIKETPIKETPKEQPKKRAKKKVLTGSNNAPILE